MFRNIILDFLSFGERNKRKGDVAFDRDVPDSEEEDRIGCYLRS